MRAKRPYKIVETIGSSLHEYRLAVSTDVQTGRHLLVVQLNPSTGDGNLQKSDPTIGKVSIWAYHHGFEKVTFVNLFAKRTPYPRELALTYSEADVAHETHQDEKLDEAIAAADVIVFAWGSVPARLKTSGHFQRRYQRLRELIGKRAVQAVGSPCRNGSPRHGRTWNTTDRCLRTYDWESE
jgi:hypothetical protein